MREKERLPLSGVLESTGSLKARHFHITKSRRRVYQRFSQVTNSLHTRHTRVNYLHDCAALHVQKESSSHWEGVLPFREANTSASGFTIGIVGCW